MLQTDTLDTIEQDVHESERADTFETDRQTSRIHGLAREVRNGLNEHLRLFYDRTKLLSKEEARSQREYVEKAIAEGDSEKLKQLQDDYASQTARQLRQKSHDLFVNDFRKPLQSMRERHVISEESYEQWISWMEDAERSGYEKTTSIRTEFRKYREQREETAQKRAKVLGEDLVRDPSKIHDAGIRAKVEFLKEDQEYFKMEIGQRKSLIASVEAALTTLAHKDLEKKKWYEETEKMLINATRGDAPALHRDKVGPWLKRIFESKATREELDHFIHKSGEGTLESLITAWRDVSIHFQKRRLDPAFDGIKMRFLSTKQFLAMHYDDRVIEAEKLRQQITTATLLKSTAQTTMMRFTGALDAKGPDRWMRQYLFNGKHTLDELQAMIGQNLAQPLQRRLLLVRRFDRVVEQARREKRTDITLPGKTAFLSLHFDFQAQTVEDLEKKLKIQNTLDEDDGLDPRVSAEISFPKTKEQIQEQIINQELMPLLKPYNKHIQHHTLHAFRHNTYQGLKQYKRVCFTNPLWSFDHGYFDGDKRTKIRNRSEEMTNRVVKRGHSREEVENVDLNIVDATKRQGIVRAHEKGENKPTFVQVRSDDAFKDLDRDIETQKDNWLWGYWVIGDLEGVPMAETRVFRNSFYKIDQLKRKYDAAPDVLSTVTSKGKTKTHKSETSHAMAA